MAQYHKKPAEIVVGFRRIADALEEMGDIDLPKFSVDLSIQVSSFQMESPQQQDERIKAVTALMAALTPYTPPAARSSDLFGTPVSDVAVGGIDVCIFTALTSSKEYWLREENARLRAQLAEAKGGQA